MHLHSCCTRRCHPGPAAAMQRAGADPSRDQTATSLPGRVVAETECVIPVDSSRNETAITIPSKVPPPSPPVDDDQGAGVDDYDMADEEEPLSCLDRTKSCVVSCCRSTPVLRTVFRLLTRPRLFPTPARMLVRTVCANNPRTSTLPRDRKCRSPRLHSDDGNPSQRHYVLLSPCGLPL